MSTSKRDLCLKALLNPKDEDCRRVSNFLFISDEKKLKQEIVNYLRDYNRKTFCNLDSYIDKLDKDDQCYCSLWSEYIKKIKKNKVGIRESSLFTMKEHVFFCSYGFAFSECLNVDPLPKIPEEYNEFQTTAMEYVHEGFKEHKKSEVDYYFNRNIENGAFYLAMKVPVKMHHNGKYKTKKKYVNECYRRAVKIMDKYIVVRGKENDAVFNDGKNSVVHDFKDELLS